MATQSSRAVRSRVAAVDSAAAVRAARSCGLTVGRQVKIGIVRGVVIGYNIGRRGRFPGRRYPLLIKTELGVTKCRLDEVLGV